MKTNHQRGFKENRGFKANVWKSLMKGHSQKADEIGELKWIAGKHPGFDHSNGHRGKARAIRGEKKFVRTRRRFHENAEMWKEAKSN